MTEATANHPADRGVDAKPPTVRVPASRSRALTRAVAWAAPTIVFGSGTALIFQQIDFQPSAIAGHLVSYSLALTGLVPGGAALLSLVKTAQWSLFALWPAPLGVIATHDTLVLRLATFGHRRYAAASLDVRYPFELSSDETEDEFDAFLPEEEQRRRLLPRIAHASSTEPLNRAILRFVAMPESEIALTLRPVVDAWRGEVAAPSQE